MRAKRMARKAGALVTMDSCIICIYPRLPLEKK